MRYPGGKNSSFRRIVNQIPPHTAYIEPFLGSGAVMRYKAPALVNIGLDLDPLAIAEFRAETKGTICPKTSQSTYQIIRADCVMWFRGPGAKWLADPDCVIYMDPPYLLETRKSDKAIYNYEFFRDDQHRELLDLCNRSKAKILISGYQGDLYNTSLAGWRRLSYTAATRGGGVTESLWINYPEPDRLHDYRYIGDDYRECEKLTRRANRWVDRLLSLPALERYAIYSAMEERVK